MRQTYRKPRADLGLGAFLLAKYTHMDLITTIKDRKQAAEDYLSKKRTAWEEYENIFNNKLYDAISEKTKSQVVDNKLSTMILDREARVMAQLATGKVKGISKNDEGAAKLMNLTLDKYILPNANAQYDFLTKLRMVDRYSNIYGNFFSLVDWDVKSNGYVGPDMWLLNIRDIFPQVGAVSLDDSDFVIVRSWKPLSHFKSLKKADGYQNLPEIIEKLEAMGDEKGGRADSDKSRRESSDYSSADTAKKSGYFEVLSMYERDRWVDFVPGADLVLREQKNPHDDGELPVLNKYSIPLLDDFMAMGDVERGKSLQYTLNSLWNLYLDSVKVSLFPPVLINKDRVADESSIKWSAAAKWLMRGSLSDAVQTLNLTPQGTSTFNNVYQVVTGSLLNLMGTTDTAVSKEVDPGFGKTPQALQMQSQRENARDNVDRFYMEQFVTKVYRKFVNLMGKKSSGKVQFRMFEEEIDELSKQYPELKEMYDEETGKLTVDKKSMGSITYDYEIVPGSTYAIDQKSQNNNLQSILSLALNPQSFQLIQGALDAEGKSLNVGELITRVITNSGIQDWDKIIVDKNKDPEALLNKDAQVFEQAMQQMAGMGGITGIPSQPPADMAPEGLTPLPAEMMNQ